MQWADSFQQRKNQLRILYPAKLSFKWNQNSHSQVTAGKYVPTRPTLMKKAERISYFKSFQNVTLESNLNKQKKKKETLIKQNI